MNEFRVIMLATTLACSGQGWPATASAAETDSASPATDAEAAPSPDSMNPFRSGLHHFEAGTEALWASDIRLTESTLLYRWTGESWEWSLSGFLNTFDEDYRPVPLFDPIGQAEDLAESTWGNQLTVRHQWLPRLAVQGGAGYYDGFDGYRSLWLDEYYRQQFSFVPGYEDADPWGANAGGGISWDYIPANATLEAEIRYLRDVVAPGYEIETDPATGAFAGLRRGRDTLDTVSLQVSTENVLNARMRSKLEAVATDTTDRDWRWAVQGTLHVALGERWIWRGFTGYTTEDPTFEAWFVGSSLEYEAGAGLHIYVAGHFYDDTGEIVNSLQLSSAAPGLQAWHAGGGFRYVWRQTSLKGFVGPYFSDYEPVEMGTAPFAHLYKDRTWWLAQLAFDVQF